jgi:hypothetical protein
MKKVFASVVTLAVVGAVPAFAESQPGDIRPESDTLPANVARFRLAAQSYWADSQWDKDGKSQPAMAKVSGMAGAAVLEYGVTGHISGQFYVPYMGEMTLESNKEYLEKQVDDAIAAGTVPASMRDAAIASQTATYEAGVKSANDKQKNSGIGDIEVGAKYKVSSVEEPVLDGIPFYASVALGLRLPTGENVQKDGKMSIGDGTTDLGLRLNADYKIIQGVMVQVENQSEFMLAKGEAWSSSLNKEIDFEYDGVRNVGYGKLVVAPGAWFAPVDVLSVSGKYAWDYAAKEKVNGVAQESEDVSHSRNLVLGASLNGFVYGLPLQFDLDYTMPMSGKNAPETSSILGTLKAFYKF